MKRLPICVAAGIALGGTAHAAPPASCASKFVGTWQHGSSNIATLTRDGQSICSGNAFCAQGTWTCNGNVLTYSNSAGSYTYTLQSPGVMTHGGIVVTRIGRQEPAPRRKLDLGAASNVTADILGIDRTAPAPVVSPPAPPPQITKFNSVAGPTVEQRQAAQLARSLFTAGKAAGGAGNWSAAEERFTEAAAQFQKAGDRKNEQIAVSNAQVAKRNSTIDQQPDRRVARTPGRAENAGKRLDPNGPECLGMMKQLQALKEGLTEREWSARSNVTILRVRAKRAGCR